MSIIYALWWLGISLFVFGLVGVLVFYSIRTFWRRWRKKEPRQPVNLIYGAWQGHNLGTTTYEPGSLPRLEDQLMKPEDFEYDPNADNSGDFDPNRNRE
jgi:hypothetical protein